MSRTLMPRAYIAMIFSSNPSIRVWPWATRRGSKLPSRSRGTSISNAPSSLFTVFLLTPLRRFVCTGGASAPCS